jgi:hypothetical protein
MNLQEIQAEIMKELSNQKKHDKHSLGYIIHAISTIEDGHYYHFLDSYKRSDLVAKFRDLLNNPKCLHNIVDLVPFASFKDSVKALTNECLLLNSRGGIVCRGTYQECVTKKNNATYYFSKNWTIKFS